MNEVDLFADGPIVPKRKGRSRKKEGNPSPDSAKLERHDGNAALGARQAKEGDTARFLVRVTSIRRRLIDEDNLCEKLAVDCCRYAGLLYGDEPGKTRIEATQRKTGKEEVESTLIEIFEL